MSNTRRCEASRSIGGSFLIASGPPNPMFGEDAEAYQKYWVGESQKLARLSTSGEFVLAQRSSHQIHQDAPELVLAVVKKLWGGRALPPAKH